MDLNNRLICFGKLKIVLIIALFLVATLFSGLVVFGEKISEDSRDLVRQPGMAYNKLPAARQSDIISEPLTAPEPIAAARVTVYSTKCLGLSLKGANQNTIECGWYGGVPGKGFIYAYFEFNLTPIPAYSTILDAELKLHTRATSNPAYSILPFRIIEDWQEAGITRYSHRLDLGENYTDSARDVSNINWWYSWNITPLIQGWVSKYFANHGFALTTMHTWGKTAACQFDDDTSLYAPKLKITYVNNSLAIEQPVPNPEMILIMPEDAPTHEIMLNNHEHRKLIKYDTLKPSDSYFPFFGVKENEYRGMNIYSPHEVGMSGSIDKISFFKTGSDTGYFENFSVRLGHAPLPLKLPILGFDQNYFADLVEVYNSSSFKINQPIDSWITLDVDNVFHYQSHYNLIVEIRWRGDGNTDILVESRFLANSLLWEGRYYGIKGMWDDYKISLKFETLSTDTIYFNNPDMESEAPIFQKETAIRSQLLYRQALIGQGGIIDKIYLLKGVKYQADRFDNINIRLINTNLTELSATFDQNYGSGKPVLVLPNTTRVIKGSRGDWIEFDVQDKFEYNNFDNLLIELRWRGTNTTAGVSTSYKQKVGYFNFIFAANDYALTGKPLDYLNIIKIKFRDSNLVWTVTDVNTSLLNVTGPDESVGGDNLGITPEPDMFGVDQIKLTLTDNLNSRTTTQWMDVVVEPVNDPPSIPIELSPGNFMIKQWFSGPIQVSWEHQDVDSPQANFSLEYKLGANGNWVPLFNSSDLLIPVPENIFMWIAPPNHDEIYIRVKTSDGEYWSPWNQSSYPFAFDNVAKIIKSVKIIDINKNNENYVKTGHFVKISVELVAKFFENLDIGFPIMANLTPFGAGSGMLPTNWTGFPKYINWTIGPVTTTPVNGEIMIGIVIPELFGDPRVFEGFTIADNLGVEIFEPSISPDQWINQKDEVSFSVNITDAGSGVDISSIQYRNSSDAGNSWSDWEILDTGDNSRGGYYVPAAKFNLSEGMDNRVQFRAMDNIGNDYQNSPEYIIQVDTEAVIFSKIAPGSAIWYKESNVITEINITDHSSGVDPESIRYRYSASGNESYYHWFPLAFDNITLIGKTLKCKVQLELEEGQDNYLQWLAQDRAGNELESDHYNYKLDQSLPKLVSASPANDGFISSRKHQCSITIEDVHSGIDTTSIKYQTSNSGIGNYTEWEPAEVNGSRGVITAYGHGEFAEGSENYIKWQASDLAGNKFDSSDFRLTMDTEGVEFSLPTPLTSTNPFEWSETLEVLCGIKVTDKLSGVDESSIEYRYSTNGSDDSGFSAWSTLGIKNTVTDNGYISEVTIKFDYGENNYIQWRAKDIAGFGPSESIKLKVQVQYLDSDNDNMPDYWEDNYNIDDPNADEDNDGLTNLEEYKLVMEYGKSTDPTNKDTDGDGVSDGDEIKDGTDPFDETDYKPGKKEEKAADFMLWIILLIIIIIFVLLVVFFLMRRRKPEEEKEELEAEEEEGLEGAAEEAEEVTGWELAEDDEMEEEEIEEAEEAEETEEAAEDEEGELEEELEEVAEVEPELEPETEPEPEPALEDDEFIDIDLEAPKVEKVVKKKKAPGIIRKAKLKKPAPGPELEPAGVDTTAATVATTATAAENLPKIMKLEKSATCGICLGVIKTGLPVIQCTCSKKYHDSCADRVGLCPSCDTDLSKAVKTYDEAEDDEESSDEELEVFDLDEEDWED